MKALFIELRRYIRIRRFLFQTLSGARWALGPRFIARLPVTFGSNKILKYSDQNRLSEAVRLTMAQCCPCGNQVVHKHK